MKGNNLYGLNLSKENIKHNKFAVLVEGNLDRNLLRPFPVLAQLVFENLNINDLVIIAKGLAIMSYASFRLDISWSFPKGLAALLLALSGGTIYSGIFLLTASLSFWIKGRTGFFPLFRISDYSRYPFTIYPTPVRLFFSWVLPFGFVAYYPSACIVRGGPTWLAVASPLVAAVTFAVAVAVWRRGLAAYESTGT